MSSPVTGLLSADNVAELTGRRAEHSVSHSAEHHGRATAGDGRRDHRGADNVDDDPGEWCGMATDVPGGGWVSDREWSRRRTAAREAGRHNPDQARRMLAGQQRALSVHRPWANLIIAGHKTVENRAWAPQHRSVLVVHAGRAWDPAAAARPPPST